MGKLEAEFQIGLAYPLWLRGVPRETIVFEMAHTGNRVFIEPPVHGAWIAQPRQGSLDQLVLRVERDCEESEPGDLLKFRLSEDAGKALFRLFETLRSLDFQNKIVPGYPVVPSATIDSNPLVQTIKSEIRFNGRVIRTTGLKSMPTIAITDGHWEEAAHAIREGYVVPSHISFALDAMYFAQFDPLRAIVMACAAWETALRYYLANIASKKDKVYLLASQGGNIPRLLKLVEAAKGGTPFDDIVRADDAVFRSLGKNYSESVRRLPQLRNKLLHEGVTTIAPDEARFCSIAVMFAIDWLFDDQP